VRPDNSEVERLCCNNSKLMSLTDWRPEVDLRKGLELTIEWIKNNLNKYKSDIYNV